MANNELDSIEMLLKNSRAKQENWQMTHPPKQKEVRQADWGILGKSDPFTVESRKPFYAKDYDGKTARQANTIAGAYSMVPDVLSGLGYSNPFTAPFSAVYDIAQGVYRGDPLQTGLATVGLPGKAAGVLSKLVPTATAVATLNPGKEAQSAPTKWISGIIENLTGSGQTKAKGNQWSSMINKMPGVSDEARLSGVTEMLNTFGEKPVSLDELKKYMKEKPGYNITEEVRHGANPVSNTLEQQARMIDLMQETGDISRIGELETFVDPSLVPKPFHPKQFTDSYEFPGTRKDSKEVLGSSPEAESVLPGRQAHYTEAKNRSKGIYSYISDVWDLDAGGRAYVLKEIQDPIAPAKLPKGRLLKNQKQAEKRAVQSALFDAAQEGADKFWLPTPGDIKNKWKASDSKATYDRARKTLEEELGVTAKPISPEGKTTSQLDENNFNVESIDDGINDILHHDPEMNTDQYFKEQREWEQALNEDRTNIYDPVTYMVETGFWETLNPHQKALISASEEIRVEDYDLAADILETAFKDGLPNNATDEMKYIFDGIKE